MSLKTALMARGGTKKASKTEVTDNLCHKLVTLMLFGQARFLMHAGDALVIHAPSLRRHIGGRTTLKDIELGVRKLQHWGIISAYKESFDVYVVQYTWPSHFPEKARMARERCSLPALLGIGLTPRKAKLTEAAVSRMAKELK